MSNFFNAPFVVDGQRYQTMEHFFQSQKTLDPIEAARIRIASGPGEAKRLGRKIELRKDWESIKLDVMRRGVKAKFDQNEQLRVRLLETGDQELQEGNYWHDLYWGIDEETGCGENWLGKILMEIREQYRSGK